MAEQQTVTQFSFEEARRQLVERIRAHMDKGHTRYAIGKKARLAQVSIDRVLNGAHAQIMDQLDRLSQAIADG